jgi:ABC-2 type transport system permease protein
MFQRFDSIAGWQFFEIVLCFSIIHMAFSTSECFVRGFDLFSGLIINGEFDRILIRPRGTVIQVIGSKFEFTRIGRFLQSIAVFIWAHFNLSIKWTITKGITISNVISYICYHLYLEFYLLYLVYLYVKWVLAIINLLVLKTEQYYL